MPITMATATALVVSGARLLFPFGGFGITQSWSPHPLDRNCLVCILVALSVGESRRERFLTQCRRYPEIVAFELATTRPSASLFRVKSCCAWCENGLSSLRINGTEATHPREHEHLGRWTSAVCSKLVFAAASSGRQLFDAAPPIICGSRIPTQLGAGYPL